MSAERVCKCGKGDGLRISFVDNESANRYFSQEYVCPDCQKKENQEETRDDWTVIEHDVRTKCWGEFEDGTELSYQEHLLVKYSFYTKEGYLAFKEDGDMNHDYDIDYIDEVQLSDYASGDILDMEELQEKHGQFDQIDWNGSSSNWCELDGTENEDEAIKKFRAYINSITSPSVEYVAYIDEFEIQGKEVRYFKAEWVTRNDSLQRDVEHANKVDAFRGAIIEEALHIDDEELFASLETLVGSDDYIRRIQWGNGYRPKGVCQTILKHVNAKGQRLYGTELSAQLRQYALFYSIEQGAKEFGWTYNEDKKENKVIGVNYARLMRQALKDKE